MTLRLEADAVFTVDSDDTVLAPGAVEIDDGLISWLGDPWQVPPRVRDRGPPAGRIADAGSGQLHGHSPMTLLRDRGRRTPARPLVGESVWRERRGWKMRTCTGAWQLGAANFSVMG